LRAALFIAFLLTFSWIHSQEPQSIRVKKEQDLVKVFFDNSDMRLTPIDRFGNVRDNKVKSFRLWIKGKELKSFSGFDNALSADMIRELNAQKKAVKIYFTEIRVEDDNGHLIQLPDLYETWFPDCAGCGPAKKKKR
jgi:uncharacterized protein YneR